MSHFWTVLLCLLNLLLCTQGIELESHGSFSLSLKPFLRRVKRNSGYNSLRDDSESRHGENVQHCSEQSPPQTNTIIKSSSSIENGAKYLSARNGVKSSNECFNLCCQYPTCDTSIYEDKSDRRCYLFDCHGLCKFKQHSNYTVWGLQRTVSPPEEEEELAHLNIHDEDKDNDGSDNNDDNQQGPVPDKAAKDGDRRISSADAENSFKSPTPAVPKPKQPFVSPHTAGLSNYCSSDVSCEDPNAACFSSACQCKDGFYNKGGLCRKVCPPPAFECQGLGTLGRGPECISHAQVCDSYMQCADGSDEFNCDEQSQETQPNSDIPSGVDKGKGSYESDSKASVHVDEDHSADSSKSDASSEDDDKSSSSKETDSSSSEEADETKTGKSSATHEGKNKTNTIGSPGDDVKSAQIHSSTRKPQSPIGRGNSKVFVTQEKVIIASSTSEAEGPIIALSLGLAFTLILIVLLGCRLRNMKHRLRKGRPLNSNEADYLINGMYL